MKKILYLILIVLFVGLITYCPLKIVKADSGWDSSYDSSSSSDWSSSSSDWSSSSSSSGEFNAIEFFIVEIVFSFIFCFDVFDLISNFSLFNKKKKNYNKIFITLIVIRGIMIIIKEILFVINDTEFVLDDIILVILFAIVEFKDSRRKKIKKSNKNLKYLDVSDSTLKEYGIEDKNKLKEELYQKYLDIQENWMNINYEKLRPLLTDEMYNMYKSQLEVLELKKEKNIMSNFELIDSKIFKIEKENNNLIVKFYLNVKMYDYVADENNKVVRGNKNRKIDISYEITYIKSLEEKQDVCPNCNAPITNNSSNKCEYCNSIIVKDSSEWVMSKKQNVGQR